VIISLISYKYLFIIHFAIFCHTNVMSRVYFLLVFGTTHVWRNPVNKHPFRIASKSRKRNQSTRSAENLISANQSLLRVNFNSLIDETIDHSSENRTRNFPLSSITFLDPYVVGVFQHRGRKRLLYLQDCISANCDMRIGCLQTP
jgi:hypothetical protein